MGRLRRPSLPGIQDHEVPDSQVRAVRRAAAKGVPRTTHQRGPRTECSGALPPFDPIAELLYALGIIQASTTVLQCIIESHVYSSALPRGSHCSLRFVISGPSA